MSGYIPGLAAPNIPLFEPDTGAIISVGTPINLSFPDNIPNFPNTIAYNVIPPSPNPTNPTNNVMSYIVSVTITLDWTNPGDHTALLNFQLAGLQGPYSNQDYFHTIPIAPYINAPFVGNEVVISFTGIVRVLPGLLPKLFVFCIPNTDTTTYRITTPPIFKRITF